MNVSFLKKKECELCITNVCISIHYRYFDREEMTMKEDFVGFIEVLNEEYKSNETNNHENEYEIPTTMDDFIEMCKKDTESTLTTREPRLTGKVIAKAILNMIDQFSLSKEAAVGQSYDGASVMSSNAIGTCRYIQDSCVNAEYYHCSAHSLNLVLIHASTLPLVRDMISTVKKVTTFLSKSNKKRIVLKAALNKSGCNTDSLKSLCETRWVERITAIENFASNFVAIVRALMAISLWQDREASSKSKALVTSVTSSSFIMSLFTCIAVTNNFDTLSKNLQTVNKSLYHAMEDIQSSLKILEEHRVNSTERFQSIFR